MFGNPGKTLALVFGILREVFFSEARTHCIARIFVRPRPHVSADSFESATFSFLILKDFSVHTKRIQIEFTCAHATDGIRIHSKAYTLCCIFSGSLFGKRKRSFLREYPYIIEDSYVSSTD